MKVSVIIPVYNTGEKKLKDCVQSILNQEAIDSEILIVDDGSAEETARLCDEIADLDDRIKVFHCPNQGVSSARNYGLKYASGEYLIFVDSDDLLIKGLIGHVNSFIDEITADIVLFKVKKSQRDITEDTTDKETIIRLNAEEIESLRIDTINLKDDPYYAGACWGKIFRRGFLEENTLKFEAGIRISEDRLFMMDCYMKNPVIYKCSAYAYVYKTNEEGFCHSYNENILTLVDQSIRKFDEHLAKGNFNDEKYDLSEMRIFNLMQCIFLYLAHENNKEGIKNRAKKLRKFAEDKAYADALKCVDSSHLRKIYKIECILLKFRLYGMSLIVARAFSRK